MTEADVIRMARQVADKDKVDPSSADLLTLTPQEMIRFAALVAEQAEAAAFERSNREWRLMCAKMVAAERERCAKVCEAIEVDQWALYKGRAPYTGKEDGRASPYVEGFSDGAGRCAANISALEGEA